MSISAKQGGFFAAIEPSASRREALESRLVETGMQTVSVGDVLLGARTQFAGQGVWAGPGVAVAFDLDLTNLAALVRDAEREPSADVKPGELLWRLYRRFGLDLLDRLRGAFAFALWDAEQKTLLAATDPYGIRPVVYAPGAEGLVVASRIRDVRLHPGVAAAIDPNALHQYLFFSAIPTPNTIYKGVRKLEPGRALRSVDGRVESLGYYDIRYRPDDSAGESYWKRAIPLEVRRAVGRFGAVSDPAHTGCFLSGGTDSSSVAGYYTQTQGQPAKTFSIGFDEPGYNELDFAHIAVDHFGTQQTDYCVTPNDVVDLVGSLPEIYDEPFGNSSVIPTFYCAKLAKNAGVDVLFAGDGGDEIFGGNERYVHNLVFERYGALPRVLRKGLLEPLLGVLPGVGPVYKAQRYVRRANIPNPDRFYSYNLLAEQPLAEIFRPEVLAQIDPDGFLKLAREHYQRAAPAHVTDRLLYLDMKLTITDNDLRKVTQMTEAAGVRVRYPLLDRDLVDFTATIPAPLKVRPGRGRYIFKEAMRGFLPDAIIAKEKHGFGLPIAPWFKTHKGLAELLEDSLLGGSARITQWVRPDFLMQMKAGFRGGDVSYYGANFWVFLMLELWLRGAGR